VKKRSPTPRKKKKKKKPLVAPSNKEGNRQKVVKGFRKGRREFRFALGKKKEKLAAGPGEGQSSCPPGEKNAPPGLCLQKEKRGKRDAPTWGKGSRTRPEGGEKKTSKGGLLSHMGIKAPRCRTVPPTRKKKRV